MADVSIGLLDTSVFIARESGRPIDTDRLPEISTVSAVTIGELQWGVLTTDDDKLRSQRMGTLSLAEGLDPFPVDERVAAAWALLRVQLKLAGQRMEINDSWIAATAIAQGLPLLTQDRGFPHGIPDLSVIEV